MSDNPTPESSNIRPNSPISADQLKLAMERAMRGNPFVIMNKTGTSVMVDPGTPRPWKTYNERYAKKIAAQAGGIAIRAKEALAILLKTTPPQNS